MTELDLQYISSQLLELVTSSLSGHKVENKEFSVVVSLPEPFVNIFEHIAEKQQTTVQELVTKAASMSISEYLQSHVKKDSKPTVTSNPMMNFEEKFSSMTQAMQTLSGLTEKLSQFETFLKEPAKVDEK